MQKIAYLYDFPQLKSIIFQPIQKFHSINPYNFFIKILLFK